MELFCEAKLAYLPIGSEVTNSARGPADSAEDSSNEQACSEAVRPLASTTVTVIWLVPACSGMPLICQLVDFESAVQLPLPRWPDWFTHTTFLISLCDDALPCKSMEV